MFLPNISRLERRFTKQVEKMKKTLFWVMVKRFWLNRFKLKLKKYQQLCFHQNSSTILIRLLTLKFNDQINRKFDNFEKHEKAETKVIFPRTSLHCKKNLSLKRLTSTLNLLKSDTNKNEL